MTTLQVTATQLTSTAPSLGLRVYVLTGAQPVSGQTGGKLGARTSSSTFEGSVTTTQTGSRVYGAVEAQTASTGTITPVSGTTVVDTSADTTNTDTYCSIKGTSTTGTPGATNFGFTSANGGIAGNIALLEVLTTGTLAEDASGSAYASGATTSNISITTVSFTPPSGSLLVALVASNGGASVETISVSGGGLNWTEAVKINNSGTDYAGVWIADVPAGGGEPPWQFDAQGGPSRSPNHYPWSLFEGWPADLMAPPEGAGNPGPNGNSPGGLIINRRSFRAVWGGVTGPFIRQNANTPPSASLVIQLRKSRGRALVGNALGVGDGVQGPPPPVVVTGVNGTVPPLIAVYRRTRAQVSSAVVGSRAMCSQSSGGIAAPPVPVIPAPRETAPLRFQRIPPRVFFRGLAVPPQQPSLLPRPPPTAIAVRPPSRRSRGIWGGLIGPPRQIPVTGGLIKRRTAARGIWGGKVVPGIQPVPVTGSGLVKRRTAARAFIQFTPVRTINATPLNGPPGNQPGSGLVKRRTSARAFIQFTPVRTVNQILLSGSLQPRPTVPVPRKTVTRVSWHGNAVPGLRSQPVTGAGLVKRRTAARGFWGGIPAPPRPVPRTGGFIGKQRTTRALWRGNAVPGIIGLPVVGTGLVKRRTTARAYWIGTTVRTVNATPLFGPPGSQPGSGLVKRRTSQRAFVQFTPVRTVNQILLSGSLQPRATVPTPRRTAARSAWRGNAVPGRFAGSLTGALIVRRTSQRAFWLGTVTRTVNATTVIPAGNQPGSGLVKRRTAAPGFWRGTVVRTKNQILLSGSLQPHPVIARRTAAPAVWRGGPVAGRRSAPVTGGLVRRRTTAPAVWRGNTAPFRYSQPVTGGLVKRRTAYRNIHLGVIVRTINALPVPGSPPGGVIVRRSVRQIHGPFIKFKPVISNAVVVLPERIFFVLGAPRTRWVSGYGPGRWQSGAPRNH